MSNKRIQKKRRKIALQRAKHRLVAQLVVWAKPFATHAEHVKMARELWPMDLDALLDLGMRVVREHARLYSPLRSMVPRTHWQEGITHERTVALSSTSIGVEG